MDKIKPHDTPHLNIGQPAPNDTFGATYTLSSGHTASVSYYGKYGYVTIRNDDMRPIEAAILFFKEIYPANRNIVTLRVSKKVSVPTSYRTTQRTYEFGFSLNGQFVCAYPPHNAKLYYRTDGSSIRREEFLKLVDVHNAEVDRKRKERGEQKRAKVIAAREERLDHILAMDPIKARLLLGRLAQWWDGHEQDDVILENGLIIDTLLASLTGIQTANDNDE